MLEAELETELGYPKMGNVQRTQETDAAGTARKRLDPSMARWNQLCREIERENSSQKSSRSAR